MIQRSAYVRTQLNLSQFHACVIDQSGQGNCCF